MINKEERQPQPMRVLVEREIYEDGAVRDIDYITDTYMGGFRMDDEGKLNGKLELRGADDRLFFRTNYVDGVEEGVRTTTLDQGDGFTTGIYRHELIVNGQMLKSVLTHKKYINEGYFNGEKLMEGEEVSLEEAEACYRKKQLPKVERELTKKGLVRDLIDKALGDSELKEYSFYDDFADIITEQVVQYDTINGFFDSLGYGGCATGLVGELIYYPTIKDYYVRHLDDIDEYLADLSEQVGCEMKLGRPRFNYAVWATFENMTWEVGNAMDVEELVPELLEEYCPDPDEVTAEDMRELLDLYKDCRKNEDLEPLLGDFITDILTANISQYPCVELESWRTDEELKTFRPIITQELNALERLSAKPSSIVEEAEQALGKGWQQTHRDDEDNLQQEQNKGIKL